MTLPIVYVEYGVANRFSDRIEIHKDLPKYPRLMQNVMKHELKHTDKVFSKEDLILDIKPTSLNHSFELIKFMIKRPKTWTQFLPISYSKDRGLIVDINGVIVFIGIIIFISAGIWLVVK